MVDAKHTSAPRSKRLGGRLVEPSSANDERVRSRMDDTILNNAAMVVPAHVFKAGENSTKRYLRR